VEIQIKVLFAIAIRKMTVLSKHVQYYIFIFCQKVKAVNNILNYSSNSNTVFELINIFLRKKSIDRLCN